MLDAIDFASEVPVLVSTPRLTVFDLVLIAVVSHRDLVVAGGDAKDHAGPLVEDALGKLLHLGHVGFVLGVRLHCLDKVLRRLQVVSLNVEHVDDL